MSVGSGSLKLLRSEQENAAKIRVLAQMSHELRTPLNTILGNAQLLARPHGKDLAPDGLDSIQRSGRQLLSLIDEILDHARGEAGQLTVDPHPEDFARFLRLFEQATRVLVAENGSHFSYTWPADLPAEVVIDAKRLQQVLDNLVSNAVRHTHGAEIRLHCHTSKTAGTLRLNFTVEDDGPGIPAEDLERIFLPFERGTGRNRQRGPGTGMGLAIARQLVRAMGGELTLQSTPSKGACFQFFILAESHAPVADRTPPLFTPAPATHVGYLGARRRILLVDDDSVARMILQSLLLDCGFLVDTAESGLAALDFIDQADLVLTDQLMEQGDGWSLLRACRQRFPELKVVMISSSPPLRPPDLDDGVKLDAFMMKPVEHARLLQCLGDLLALAWQPVPADLRPEPASNFDIGNGVYPDAEAVAELQGLLERGELTGMMDWATELKATHPSLATYADRVYAAARCIDMETLQSMCNPTGS